jgi:hypothetical protein
MMDMAAETTMMTIAGGVAAAVVKVARVAKVLASPARDPASLARDLASLARDLMEAVLGGAQSLMMATAVTAAIAGGAAAALAAAVALASPERDEDTDVPTCVRRQSRGDKSFLQK